MERSTMSVIVCQDFLAPNELDCLMHCARTLTTWDTRADGYWSGRIAHTDHLQDLQARDMLCAIRGRVRAEIGRAYGLTRPLFSDTLQIVRWPEGFEQHPHADSENPGGVPHPYAWRSYASIIYLNDDFEGGQIYFPDLRLAPPIRPGMLVFFPGTLGYLHGVTKVIRGTRYTIASFWTFDPSRQDRLPI
jgi:hypothetical protein